MPPTFPFAEIKDIVSIITVTANDVKIEMPKFKSPLYFAIANPDIAAVKRIITREVILMLRIGFWVFASINDDINDSIVSIAKENIIPKIITV